ncbi:MAG: hypothetical protein MJ250_09245 [Alphaproteobacteria bacterium]|nr:hypothetical protein [Alphaproteobacteria bacterium]
MKKSYLIENDELMKEWDWEENEGLNPHELTFGSNNKAWWKCSMCQGKWQATICDRTRIDGKKTNCPYCAGQKVLTGYNDLATRYPEILKQWHPNKNILNPNEVMPGISKKVWWVCPNGHEYEQSINARILHPNSCPICSGQKVVEGINDLQSKYPNVAKEWLQGKNSIVTPATITWGSNKKFWWKCGDCGYEWQARVSDRTRRHNGCPACANKVLFKGHNDLATTNPNIAQEWHPTKNGNLTPSDIVRGSGNKVWWVCSKGHEYQQSVSQRISAGRGCPICANQKILVGCNDLATTHPKVAKEWHPTKNGILKPNNVVAGTKRKVWWICSNGHEYEQAIDKRTVRGFSCPYCSNQKVLKGYNDLVTTHPEIAKEWHPTKNGSLKPSNVTFGSGKKVWWICPIGHEYQTSVHSRGSGGTNCPICNSSRLTSFGEQAIYYYIKTVYPDTLNRYNEFFSTSMEFDVYIPSLKIAIEYDGGHWHQTEDEHKREIKKYNFCKKNNIILIRVKEKNKQNWNDVADRTYYIPKTKRNDFSKLEQAIYSIVEDINKNVEIDINISRDKLEIQNYLYKIEHSLADERPDVAKKWNYKRNGILYPNMFSVSSNEIVWWKCSDCGYEWKSSINSMTREGRYGCSICSKIKKGKTFTKLRVSQRGSLAKNMPELAKEWHPTKNGDLTPNDITSGRFKPVWWKCSKCGYEWQSSPNNRKKGIGCPCCSGRVPKKGVNDLKTKYPELVKEWDYEKNYPLRPEDFLPGSGKKVWWKCSICGKSWQAIIVNRVKKSKQQGCRKCKSKIRSSKESKQINFDF